MSNAGSSRASSTYSFRLFEDRKKEVVSCNLVTWHRLQALSRAIRSTEETIGKQRELMEADGPLATCIEAFQLASESQNLHFVNEQKSSRLDQLKRICAKKRIALAQLEDERKKKASQLSLLVRRNVSMAVRVDNFDRFISERRKYLEMYSSLLRLRRKVMIKELSEVFDISLSVERVSSKPDCPCKKLDLIRNVHLPSIVSLAGHSDTQLSTSLGLAVHFLLGISRIIDYPLRYPLQSAASTSHIYVPREDKTLSLFGTRWRSDRDRLAQAVTLLSRNVAQLRSDSGFSSPHLDRLLHSIKEWTTAVELECIPPTYSHRPWNSVSSPAHLFERLEENEDLDSVNIILDVPFSSPTNDEFGPLEDWSIVKRSIDSRRQPASCASDELDTSAVSCLLKFDEGKNDVISNGKVVQ